MGRQGVGRKLGRVAATVVAATAVIMSIGSASTASTLVTAASDTPESIGQRFVPDVAAAFNGLSRRADALGFRRGTSPEAGLCTHYQGIARKDGADGTPYLFLTKSGNVPTFCEIGGGDDGDGFLIVVRMGSRQETHGERLGRNLYPYSGQTTPTDDRAVTSIPLDRQDGRPGYRHPGGMQLLGNVLAIGAEEHRWASDPRAAVLFYDVSDPESPRFITSFSPPDLDDAVNAEFGADPVGLTAIKAPDGTCCRFLMIVAGGDGNRDVRFFRSKPDPGKETTTLNSEDLDWDEVGRYTGTWLLGTVFVSDLNCSGATFPTGLGTQHQTFNFVREGGLDGQLYMIAMMRDGAVVNPLADEDEFIDLYRVNVSPEGIPVGCPLTRVARKRVGLDGIGPSLQAWGDFQDVGSFAAGSSAYVSPTGELLAYVTDHEDTIIGEYRPHSLVRANSPTLRPTASVDGPFAVDEGSTTDLTGEAKPSITKAFVQLFSDSGVGIGLDDSAWLSVEYGDRDVDRFDDLCKLNLGGNDIFDPCGVVFPDPLWDRVSSIRWFAPPGCDIQANDYPIRSDDFPGDGTVILRGTGQFEEVHSLTSLRVYRPVAGTLPPWPVSPPPTGEPGEDYNYNDDIEGVTFYTAYRDGDSVVRDHHGCESYYGATKYTLGWDLDNDGSFESSGAPVTFSAALLDGPSFPDVQARATHTTDTSTVGTGVPIPVRVEVRNVAPTVTFSSVKDTLGHELDGGATKAVVGLPVELSLQFTDPGLADTQTASVDWGDGSTLDTSFTSFSDALNGATGDLVDSHVFSSPGTKQITVTVTDDDGGATPVQVTIEVLSLKEAIKNVADTLTELIQSTTNAELAAALRSARDQLIGNHAGTPPTNGATDKLDANDPSSAIVKLKAAIGALISAESVGGGDLSAYEDLLGLVAEGIATATYEKAQAAIPTPSKGQAKTLASIAALIDTGHQRLVNNKHLNACDSFKAATDKALGLLK